MNPFFRRLSVIITLLNVSALPPQTASAGTISDRLASKLETLSGDRTVPIIVSFTRTVDPLEVRRAVSSTGRMIRSMKDSIRVRAGRLLPMSGTDHPSGPVRLFWINQTIAMTATLNMIEQLELDPEVGMIEWDADAFSYDDVPPPEDVTVSPLILSWNLRITGVDSVWKTYGLDGSGIVIGSLDTGIDTTHPALAGKLRRWDAWKDFIFGQPVPYDNLGHGTFGSGIIVGGSGTASSGPGIAYGSRLVVGKMIDAGASPISTVTSSMQWMLDPDGIPETDDFPRIVNNSWYSGTRGSTYAYAAASAWRAAGIIPVFCAGNSGPSGGSTRSPGDYKNCISVGGTNSNDDRYASTSVGPSPADTNYFPADGRKPDFSAPGEEVYSSVPGGGYGYSSGTSWSAPHVSGIIALMLQANPALGYDDVCSILKRTSFDAGTEGYDYVFGYGRVSAMGAVREALKARIGVQSDSLLHTSESGDTAYIDIRLNVWPRDTVWITLTSSDTTEGTVSPDLITFTFADWEIPKRVVVTGRDDELWDEEIGYSVSMSTASNDPLYDGLVPDPVSVVNSDDEVLTGTGVTLRSGWNIVSLPTVLGNTSRAVVFPGSVSAAYLYESGYYAEDPLRRGVGYWLKFDSDQFIDFPGDTTTAETVIVRRGWNLVGSLTVPIAPSDIVTIPPGLVTSFFYGYNGAYYAADAIRPGIGYWVKVSGDGVLILRTGTGAGAAGSTKIIGGDERHPPRRGIE